MHELDQVETVLARLMPPALRENFQRDLDEMIDDLAGQITPVNALATPPSPKLVRWQFGGGIAAALAVFAALFPFTRSPETAEVLSHERPFGIVLVSESGRIESMTDEGWQEDPDGFAVHAVRLNVIEENQVRDEATGMIVNISQPREELLLSPISAF